MGDWPQLLTVEEEETPCFGHVKHNQTTLTASGPQEFYEWNSHKPLNEFLDVSDISNNF